MSATEVVKKRGRPKKVVEDVSAVEEAKVKGTRNASTKAAPATRTASSSASVKTLKSTPKLNPKTAKTIPSKAKEEPKKAAVKPARPTPVTPETSKILQKVAQTRAEQSRPPPQPAQASSPPRQPPAKPATPAPPPAPTPTPSSIPQRPPNTTIPLPRNPIDPSNPQHRPLQPPQPAQPHPRPSAYPTPKLPIIPPHSSTPPRPATAAFNAQVEANKVAYTGKLDPKYRPAARRVTAIMVGIPVVLVTSWELYQRFFMGKDVQRVFEKAESKAVW
ncbi:hypothetical protein BDV96DRAFT_652119 [Lophiotrema nucula]|uniref:Uncharacterized protein n=1 Tax=Lophiotrema nucula TaxID=690887 RepID=A0A6A5YQB2_9PLEO|nr:hypothetical protein BDV96DRAFT_652119 [Lophiotrema nucula]